ncbi:ABC transporter permease [Cohnella thailandensis]|nr:ABC transporter permease subunit [Cohnella thailandensis]MBP1974615.1 putative aldouronate transport system permease protein [Cohnella thailandensis]
MLKPGIYRKLVRQRYLLAMCLPFVAWVLIFSYTPLFGWIMAFKDYKPAIGILQSEWTGFRFFKEFLVDPRFYEIVRNTFVMGILNVVFGTACAILLALMLNEVRNKFFKRSIQTISYLPHFVSWVIVSNIFYTVLSTDGGVVNNLLLWVGLIDEPINWMAQGKLFWVIVTVGQVWKEAGWTAIIYFAAMTSIDKTLYEAGEVDGLGRIGKIRYITLPGIMPTIAILTVLNIGNLFNASGFDPSYLLGNNMTLTYSDNLAVYTYRYGLQMSRFSMSAALGIFNSVICLILLFSANKLSGKFIEGKAI